LLGAATAPNMLEVVVAAPNDAPKAGGGAVVAGVAMAPNAGAAPDALKMLVEEAAVVEVGVPKVAGEPRVPNPEGVVIVVAANPVAFGVPKPEVSDAKPDGVAVVVETALAPNLRELSAGAAAVVGVKLNPPTGVGKVGSAEGTAADTGVEVAPKERPVAVVGVPYGGGGATAAAVVVMVLAEVKGDVIKGKLSAGAGVDEAGVTTDVTLKI
jgi:hypothetical protein